MAITRTKRAAEEVKSIMNAQALDPKTFVRTIIVGGGCSGMQYSLGFDTEYNPLIDARYESDGVAVVAEKKFSRHADGEGVLHRESEISRRSRMRRMRSLASVARCFDVRGSAKL